MINMLKNKNKEKANLLGMMDLLMKDSFKKVLFLGKVFFRTKNKTTLMKIISKADKNMVKEFKGQNIKVMKVFEFMFQGILCLG